MSSLRFPRRCLRYCTSLFLAAAGIFIVYFITQKDWTDQEDDTNSAEWLNIIAEPSEAKTNCPYILDTENILAILRIGATEILDKVPIHLQTTLRCVRHYVIFSDYEEDFLEAHTRDVLRNVSEEMRRINPDFGIYNRLRALGRDGLVADDWKDDKNGPFGKPGNPGWKLDKWKFVPMIDEALLVKPDAVWFVFLEPDTYIVWQNMVRWLSQLDPTKAHYLGAPMQMGDEIFAYGGAGIVLSRSAMELVSRYRAEHVTAVEQMTAEDWAGDHVLGRVLIEKKVPLVWSWPSLNPASVWVFEYLTLAMGRRPWCYPAVSFHHMSPGDIQNMWLFEQQWLRFKRDSVLLHMDIFKWQIQGVMDSIKDDWDNLSTDQQPRNNKDSPKTTEECAQRCYLMTDCLQYSYSDDICMVSKEVIGGVHREGVQSGWMQDRVTALVRSAGHCRKIQYVTP